jgi:IS4 transposase
MVVLPPDNGVRCSAVSTLRPSVWSYLRSNRLLMGTHCGVAQSQTEGGRGSSLSKRLVFLTNNFTLPALTITKLYRMRWRVELFFKWIKQHLRIKAFFGTTENAVKTQIWIAVSVYVLVAIVKKRLNLSATLYEMLQILSLTMFERMLLDQLLTLEPQVPTEPVSTNQLNLFQ